MYHAPLKDLQFVLHDLIGDADLQACRELGDYSADLADSVLAEAGMEIAAGEWAVSD